MNKILESLSASLGELINRSFVTAGLAPGLLLLAGCSLYQHGLAGTRKTVEDAFQSGEKFLETFGWWVIILLSLAWMLVAGRRLIQRILADPPVWKLRDAMLQSQLSRWTAVQADLEQWLKRHGALKWQDPGPRFVLLYGGPNLRKPTYDPQRLESSTKEAQAILGKEDVLSLQDLRKLGDALGPIWLASRWPRGAKEPADVAALLQSWRTWLEQDDTRTRRLDDAAEQSEREVHRAFLTTRDYYPRDPTWVQPTRFGNRLAALDDYAQQRYGMDTTTLWSRLWGVLGAEERDEFRNAEQAVTARANTWLVFLALAAFIIIAEATEGVRLLRAGTTGLFDFRALGFILGAGIIATLAYSAAVTSVGGMMEVMYRWIDLKRLALLKGLGHEPPRTVAEEMTLFQELDSFYVQAIPRSGWRKLKIEQSA